MTGQVEYQVEYEVASAVVVADVVDKDGHVHRVTFKVGAGGTLVLDTEVDEFVQKDFAGHVHATYSVEAGMYVELTGGLLKDRHGQRVLIESLEDR